MAEELYTDMAPFEFTPDGGSNTVGPLFSISLPFGLANQAQRHSGQRFTSTILHAGGQPTLTISMPAKFALDNFGLGLNKLSDFKFWLATYADGERQAGATHSNYQAASGAYLVVDSISASNKSVATASCRVIPLAGSDVADPWTRNDDASLPTLSAEPTLNTLGPMANGGTAQDGLQSISVNLNQLFEPLPTDGDRYAKRVRYAGGSPTINGTHVGTLGINTLAGFEGVNVTDLDFYLRENDTANGTLKTTGIELAIADGYLQIDSVANTQDGTTSTNFSVVCESSSGTHPISYTASASIP